MSIISEKVSYLRGLMEGMKLDQETNEGKLFAAIIDALDEISDEIEELNEDANDMMDMLDDISDQLSELDVALPMSG